MAVGAQIDTSERETGNTKIPLLNSDQEHEATKAIGQYRYTLRIILSARCCNACYKVNLEKNQMHSNVPALCNLWRGRYLCTHFIVAVFRTIKIFSFHSVRAVNVKPASIERVRVREGERERERAREREMENEVALCNPQIARSRRMGSCELLVARGGLARREGET